MSTFYRNHGQDGETKHGKIKKSSGTVDTYSRSYCRTDWNGEGLAIR
jgi:hypothetical protein